MVRMKLNTVLLDKLCQKIKTMMIQINQQTESLNGQQQHYLYFEKIDFIFMNISAGNGRIFNLTLQLCTSWNEDVCRLFKYCLTLSVRKIMLSHANTNTIQISKKMYLFL